MSISTSIRERMTTIRNQVREHRQERAEHRALERELASFRTPRDIDELLALMADQEGPEAERIRDILLDHRRTTVGLGGLG